MSDAKKQIFYKSYGYSDTLWDIAKWDVDSWDSTPTITGIWQKEVISQPTIRSTANSGAGELRVTLARPFNSFGEGDDVALGNILECYVSGENDTQSVKVFSGRITSYSPRFEGVNGQSVEVVALAAISELQDIIVEDVDGNTAIEYIDEDPADIIADLVDKARLQGTLVNYTSTSLEPAGTTVSLIINLMTAREAIEAVIKASPAYYYYYVDAAGIIYSSLSNINAADHTLTVGREIKSFSAEKTAEQVVNQIYFVGGTPVGQSQLYTKYTRPSSVTAYGLKSKKIIDQRVTVQATADAIAEKTLDELELPPTRLELTVIDDHLNPLGYDIESMQPGQTIRIRNLKAGENNYSLWDLAIWDTSVWDSSLTTSVEEILQIQSITYTPYYATIEAANRVPDISRKLEKTIEQVEAALSADIPIIPTTT